MKNQFARICNMVWMTLFVLLTGCVNIVNQPQASVDATGHVLTVGPHVMLHPIYWAKVNGKWVAKPVETLRLSQFATITGSPLSISPALPSDYGATIDASASPLFVAPDTDDVNQNQADTCYLLAVWDSLLRQNPQYAGTIMVRGPPALNSITFRRSLAAPVTVQLDNRISSGQWAHPSPSTGAIDACILERAYCYFRTGANTVASINFGFPGSAMTDLGISNVTLIPTAAGTPAAVVATLANHFPCVASSNGVIPAGIPIVAGHAYSIVAASLTTVTLRNPWGADAQGQLVNPKPDSMVTINWADFGKVFTSVSCGTGYAALPNPPPPPLPPLIFTGNFPATIKAGQILKVVWTSNADKIVITDILWRSTTTEPANGSFMCMMPPGDVWTFKATRAADSATIVKTVIVTP